MPEMDGYQATARIRADSRFASFPIIAMTAHATSEERAACIAAGMNDHISKPIYPNVLFDTVARHFHPGPAAARADAAPSTLSPEDPLPVIDGLDTADGLVRVGGNRTLYLKLVRQFVGDERDAVVRIRERLAAGDHATAERMAHTVKGVAASLGARELQAIAGDLERAVKERASTEPLCDRLAGALSAFAAAVGSTLGEPAPAPSSEPSGRRTRGRFAGRSPGWTGA